MSRIFLCDTFIMRVFRVAHSQMEIRNTAVNDRNVSPYFPGVAVHSEQEKLFGGWLVRKLKRGLLGLLAPLLLGMIRGENRNGAGPPVP